MKMTDEQIKYIQRVADSRTDGAGDIIQQLLFDRQAWKEEVDRLTTENERLRVHLKQSFDALKEIKSIIDSIPKGNKEGRADYVTMVTGDKIHRLRQLVEHVTDIWEFCPTCAECELPFIRDQHNIFCNECGYRLLYGE